MKLHMVRHYPRTGVPESYFALVRRFPLLHIETDKQLIAAQAILDELLATELDPGEQLYLEALTDLVALYEEAHVVIAEAPAQEVLRELMRQHGLNEKQLSKKANIALPTLTDFLLGLRSLEITERGALAEFFNVAPNTFLPTHE